MTAAHAIGPAAVSDGQNTRFPTSEQTVIDFSLPETYRIVAESLDDDDSAADIRAYITLVAGRRSRRRKTSDGKRWLAGGRNLKVSGEPLV